MAQNFNLTVEQVSAGFIQAVGVTASSAVSMPPATMPPYLAMKVPKTREQMAESLMRMLMAGPEVSLRGSPTVSPVTAAAWVGVPFLTTSPSMVSLPASTNFLALSQAPPELEAEKAIWIPETMQLARTPLVAW